MTKIAPRKKTIVLLIIGVFAVSAGLLPAQEPPDLQLQFIHQLRQKGLADLALQYIDKIKQNAPPELAPLLPLESARSRVALSQLKAPEDRTKLLAEAQKELEQYLAAKKQSDEAPQLSLEIARVIAYQGQAYLGQAFRSDKAEDRDEFAKKSRAKFEEARKKYDESIKAISDLLGKTKNPDPKQQAFFKKLAADLMDGKLDRAKTFVFEGRSYLDTDDTGDRKKMAETYEAALGALKGVVEDKSGSNDEARWLAGAWYMDVARRADKGDAAETIYKKISTTYDDLKKIIADPKVAKVDKDARMQDMAIMVPGVRLARYFYIQAVRGGQFKLPPEAKGNKAKFLQDECTRWLIEFKPYMKTPEGYGVRLELAYALQDQALVISKKYSDPKAKELYDKAQEQFDLVAGSHSDLSEEASRQSIIIQVARIGDTASPEALKNFKECYLKARFEMTQLQATGKAIKKLMDDGSADSPAGKKELADLRKKQKGHLKMVIASFNRGLELATPLTPPNQVDEVRYFLAYTYLISGDPYRAAVMADFLTHKDPPGKHAPLAATYGLQAYDQIVSKYNDPANLDRQLGLAEFVIKDRAAQWKDQPVVASAKYALALYYMRQKEPVKSIEYLEDLQKNHKEFRAYIFSQCQLALLALNVSAEALKYKDDDPDKALKKAVDYRTRALDALRKIPTLPKSADPATAAMFFTAQLNQGTILYNDYVGFIKDGNEKVAETRLKDMVKFTKDLLKQFDEFKGKLDPELTPKIEASLSNLDKYARFGEARLAYKAGEYDKVLSKPFTGDIVDGMEALAKAKGELALSDYQVTGDLLGLALRANVQKGNFKEAEKVLDLVHKLKNPNALDDKSNPTAGQVLQNLLADLSSQIAILKKEKKDDKLKETVKNFSQFFDALVKNKEGAGLSYNERVFLANCYASVEHHSKAADLYGSLPMPTVDPKVKLTKEEEAKLNKDVQKWWFLQVNSGEEWRRAKEFKKAKEVLQKVLDDPKAAGKIQAQKEMNLVLEDEGKFGPAITSWNSFLKNPSLLAQMNAKSTPEATKRKAKEFYYDAFYHYIYCWFMFSQNDGKAKEEKHLTTAANYIWRLELDHKKAEDEAKKKNLDPPTDTGWALIGPRLNELMNSAGAEKLKSEYEKQKKDYLTKASGK